MINTYMSTKLSKKKVSLFNCHGSWFNLFIL